MKNLKTGIVFIVLGNLAYLSKDFLGNGGGASDFGDFTDGLLLGFGVIINIIGIIFVYIYMAKESKRKSRRRRL